MKISVQTVLDLLHSIIYPVAPDLVRHMQRTSIICWYLGKRAGFDENTVSNAFLAGMLHDIGILNREREEFISTTVDTHDGHEQLGASMVTGIRFLQPVKAVLEDHHREWAEPIAQKLPIIHHLVHMADEFELFLRGIDGEYVAQRENIIKQFLNRSERWPVCLAEALCDSSFQDGFWFRLSNTSLTNVLHVISPLKDTLLDHQDVLEVCQLISRIVDRYSSFTQTHSSSVAHVAKKLAELYGYDKEIQDKICIAGYLHDIGKLFIPLNILEKKGQLEAQEYAFMKQHSYKTLVMLNPMKELGEIMHWAANHHERLDGSGYPFRLNAASLDMPSRILAVADVFTAMTENRPYRSGMHTDKALEILHEEASNYRLDQNIVNILSHNVHSIKRLVAIF